MQDFALGSVSLLGSAVEVRPHRRQMRPHLTGVRVRGGSLPGLRVDDTQQSPCASACTLPAFSS